MVVGGTVGNAAAVASGEFVAGAPVAGVLVVEQQLLMVC